MSRVGKLPIEIPAGVQVNITDGFVVVKGPKGELREKLNKAVRVNMEGNQILVTVDDPENKKEKALWGLFRNLIRNMVVGVVTPFEKKLEINGVGFKASASGKKLMINVGFSHPVEFELPANIEGKVEDNVITISGANKSLVGEICHKIRKIKEPEPYKGKGIKYVDEVIRRKEGKTAGAKSE